MTLQAVTASGPGALGREGTSAEGPHPKPVEALPVPPRDRIDDAVNHAAARIEHFAQGLVVKFGEKVRPALVVASRFSRKARELGYFFDGEIEARQFRQADEKNLQIKEALGRGTEKSEEWVNRAGGLVGQLVVFSDDRRLVKAAAIDLRRVQSETVENMIQLARHSPEALATLTGQLGDVALDAKRPDEQRLLAIEALDKIIESQGENVDLAPLLEIYSKFMTTEKVGPGGASVTGAAKAPFEENLERTLAFRVFKIRDWYSVNRELMASLALQIGRADQTSEGSISRFQVSFLGELIANLKMGERIGTTARLYGDYRGATN